MKLMILNKHEIGCRMDPNLWEQDDSEFVFNEEDMTLDGKTCNVIVDGANALVIDASGDTGVVWKIECRSRAMAVSIAARLNPYLTSMELRCLGFAIQQSLSADPDKTGRGKIMTMAYPRYRQSVLESVIDDINQFFGPMWIPKWSSTARVFEIAEHDGGLVIRETDFCVEYFKDNADAGDASSWTEAQAVILAMIAYKTRNS